VQTIPQLSLREARDWQAGDVLSIGPSTEAIYPLAWPPDCFVATLLAMTYPILSAYERSSNILLVYSTVVSLCFVTVSYLPLPCHHPAAQNP